MGAGIVIPDSKGYNYINKVMCKQSSDLKPINGLKFVAALEEFHGQENTTKATRWLFNQDNKSFKGVEEFKNRFTQAIVGDAKLSGEDQKYVADVAQRVALKILA